MFWLVENGSLGVPFPRKWLAGHRSAPEPLIGSATDTAVHVYRTSSTISTCTASYWYMYTVVLQLYYSCSSSYSYMYGYLNVPVQLYMYSCT